MIRKVYLASWFNSRDVIRSRAEDLRRMGIGVTSRWLDETIKKDAQTSEVPEDFLRDTARIDIEDVLLADTVILNVPSKHDLETEKITLATWARGGRHFEAGFQYATMVFASYLNKFLDTPRRLILVGHRENIFHFLDGIGTMEAMGFTLPKIECYDDWDDVLTQLLTETRSNDIAQPQEV